MLKRNSLKSLAVLSVLVLTAHCFAEVPATAYDSWKSFKVGTTVVVEQRDSDDAEDVRRITTRLVKLEDGTATVEEVTERLNGKATSRPSEAPTSRHLRDQKLSTLVGTRPATATQPANPVEGEEDIIVAGQKIHAQTMKDVRYETQSYTYYVSDKVPGAIAIIKFVELRPGHPTRIRTWTVVEIKEPAR